MNTMKIFQIFKHSSSRIKMNKRADTNLIETVIFIVLNLLFFSVMLVFVYSSGNNSFVYEQSYAKQIALIIDNAKPDMNVTLNIKELIEIAEKSDQDKKKIVSLDKEKNLVKISSKEKGGYSYEYFSDYNVDLEINGEWISINIGKKYE